MKKDLLKQEAKEVVNSVVYSITEDIAAGETEHLFFERVSSELYDALDDDKYRASLNNEVEKLLKKQGIDVSVNIGGDDEQVIVIEWALQD